MQKPIYCLEVIADNQNSIIEPSLAQLTKKYGVTNIYQNCNHMDDFIENIELLIYEDKNFKTYPIVYLVCKGENGTIEINNFLYTLEELAEVFEGKLKGKILHFANTMLLDLEEETFQYFLDVTGAKALSGYKNNAPILSSVLDNLYFSLAQVEEDNKEIVKQMYQKQYAVTNTFGFVYYY
jgi:hypothetical protein